MITSKGYASIVCLLGMATIMSNCSRPPSEEQTSQTYQRNVESCICRYLDLEDDFYSGLTYDDFVSDCNDTVRQASPDGYDSKLTAEPKIDEIRCQDKVDSWSKVVAEIEALQNNNRQLSDELKGSRGSSEPFLEEP